MEGRPDMLFLLLEGKNDGGFCVIMVPPASNIHCKSALGWNVCVLGTEEGWVLVKNTGAPQFGCCG